MKFLIPLGDPMLNFIKEDAIDAPNTANDRYVRARYESYD